MKKEIIHNNLVRISVIVSRMNSNTKEILRKTQNGTIVYSSEVDEDEKLIKDIIHNIKEYLDTL